MPVVQMIRQDINFPDSGKNLVIPSEIAYLEKDEKTICAFCAGTFGKMTVFKKSMVCESCRQDLLSD